MAISLLVVCSNIQPFLVKADSNKYGAQQM